MPTKPAVPKPRLRAADGSFAARGTLTPKILRKIWSSPITAPVAGISQFEAKSEPIEFYSAFHSEKVDTVNAVIRGVSVITSGVIARGHNLEVDSKTLEQMKTCAESKGQVPVKVNHKSGAEAVCGFLTNFHLDGDKLKADWHLLKSHPQKDQILEVAERMPKGVGLSASFLPPAKTEKGKARCEELLSVDYVTLPAANPDGMFSAKVDSNQNATPKTMSFTPEQIEALKGIISEAIAPVTEKLSALEQNQNLLTNPPDLEALAEMSDEELAQLGLTPEDVAEAIAEANEALSEGDEGDEGEDVSDAQGSEGEGEGELASAGAGAGAGAATGLEAEIAEIRQFAAELKAAKERQLHAEDAQLVTELNAKFEALVAQNEALRNQLEVGGKPASAGVVRNPTQFQTKTGARIDFGTKEPGQFEELVVARMEADSKLSKTTAFAAVIRSNPEAYQDYLVRRGIVKA